MKTSYFASPEIMALTQHSKDLGWYSEADWECFIRTGVVFGHQLQSGEIVSSAYLSNFENRVGWLGAVIVNPRFQGKKLGRDLIQKAIAIAPDHDFVLGVIATERGKKMFEQGGFVEVGNTHKFVSQTQPNDETTNLSSIRKSSLNDLNAIALLDQQAIGYNRIKLLRERFQSSLSSYVVQTEAHDLTGFIFASSDGRQTSLGPLVAANVSDATALVRAATSSGGQFRIDIPHWQSDFIKEVSSLGFTLERICPLLTYKGEALPIASDSYFALISQALG